MIRDVRLAARFLSVSLRAAEHGEWINYVMLSFFEHPKKSKTKSNTATHSMSEMFNSQKFVGQKNKEIVLVQRREKQIYWLFSLSVKFVGGGSHEFSLLCTLLIIANMKVSLHTIHSHTCTLFYLHCLRSFSDRARCPCVVEFLLIVVKPLILVYKQVKMSNCWVQCAERCTRNRNNRPIRITNL